MRGKIDGLAKIANQAERNGAIRCAPRELALAKSHLEFAEVELDQGFVSKASDHLAIAEPNAHAAYDLSPPEKCAERGFVMPPPTPDDPDTDGDGILDSRDMCILEPEDKDGYLDDDGCPELDNDLDGILDAADKCPNEPEDPDGFEDADGCPDPDNDKDTRPRPRRSVPERGLVRRTATARLPAQAGARRRHRQGDQDHAADPLRVRQGHHPAGELPDPRRRRRGPAEEPGRCASRSRGTPTTRARPPTT